MSRPRQRVAYDVLCPICWGRDPYTPQPRRPLHARVTVYRHQNTRCWNCAVADSDWLDRWRDDDMEYDNNWDDWSPDESGE